MEKAAEESLEVTRGGILRFSGNVASSKNGAWFGYQDLTFRQPRWLDPVLFLSSRAASRKAAPFVLQHCVQICPFASWGFLSTLASPLKTNRSASFAPLRIADSRSGVVSLYPTTRVTLRMVNKVNVKKRFGCGFCGSTRED